MSWIKGKKKEVKKDKSEKTKGSWQKEDLSLDLSEESVKRNPQLRRLSRSELLELLIQMSREKDQLQAELDQAKKELADRTLRMNKAGDLAQASLALNDIFERAQQAADDYLAAVKANAGEITNIKANAIEDSNSDNNAVSDVDSLADSHAGSKADGKADAETEVRSEEVEEKKDKKVRRDSQRAAKLIEKKLRNHGIFDTAPDVEGKN